MSNKGMKVHLFIVDPQVDFMGNDDGTPFTVGGHAATLPVKGAVTDMNRLVRMIERVGPKLDDIHVTLDSHHPMHIAHPRMWVDQNGRPPGPFTIITIADITAGIWRARNQAHQKRMAGYVQALESSGKFLHCIWPEHCLIGSAGHAVYPPLFDALSKWEREHMGVVNYFTKGSAVFTEHFGGLMAQVPDPNDPSTQLNTDMLKAVEEADLAAFSGEALSHCVKTTVEQFADNVGDAFIKRMVLLVDCMSPVPSAPGTPPFEAIGQQFLKDMQARGMQLMTSTDFLA